MDQSNFITRMSNAWRQLKARAKPERPVSTPDFGQQSPMSAFQRWSDWNYWGGRNIDYREEVGRLEFSSLAMAVANFTALRIPEAKPAVMKSTKAGGQDLDYSHPVAQLIRRPNQHHVWGNYAGACSTAWWFAGNIYFYEARNPAREIIELWYLPYDLVTERWPGDGGTPDVERWAEENGESVADLDPFLSHYEYRRPGKTPVLYPARDVLHIKRNHDIVRPRRGIGAFESLYKELFGDDKMAMFTASIMRNMGIQVPVIAPKDNTVTIGEVDAEAMKARWIAKTTGAHAGEPVILNEPVVLEKFGFSPKELSFSEIRQHIESRVCSVCQISPAALQFMVGVMNGTSYASSEQARQQGYEEVIIPIQSAWAEEITWQLLSEYPNSEGSEFVFDTSKVRVLQEDADNLVKRESEVFKSGGSTLDEFRTAVGKQPVGPPLGDIRMVPSLSTPMTPDRLEETASNMPQPQPTQPIDPSTLAKFVDMEQMFEGLEKQMKEFVAK